MPTTTAYSGLEVQMELPISILKRLRIPQKKWNVRIIDFYLHDQPIRKGMLSGGKEIINTSVFEARDFHLSHNDNAFSIEFSTRELNNSERITYLYTINNTPWVKLPKGVNRVSFSDLPRRLSFRIKAEDYLLESDTDEITIHIAYGMVGIGLGHADLCLIGSSSRLWHHPASETPLPHKAGNDATYPC